MFLKTCSKELKIKAKIVFLSNGAEVQNTNFLIKDDRVYISEVSLSF